MAPYLDWVCWLEGAKTGFVLEHKFEFQRGSLANLWETTNVGKQDANNVVFYFYYEQLCKAISFSPRVTREVIDMYGNIMHFAVDQNHIYL